MEYPRVGVGVWVRRNGKVLLGKRVRGAEPGTWCPPGGGIDLYERAGIAAIRELQEETGLDVKDVRFLAYVDDVREPDGSHWVTLYFTTDSESGEPRDAENEIGNWSWFEWDKLPEPLFTPTRNFVKNGYNPLTV